MSETWTVTMPKLGETVTEGTIGSWIKKAGDTGALRQVEIVEILPSQSIGNLVKEMEHLIPYPIRYLLRGLGSNIG